MCKKWPHFPCSQWLHFPCSFKYCTCKNCKLSHIDTGVKTADFFKSFTWPNFNINVILHRNVTVLQNSGISQNFAKFLKLLFMNRLLGWTEKPDTSSLHKAQRITINSIGVACHGAKFIHAQPFNRFIYDHKLWIY